MGGSSKKQTIGYRYYLGMHMVLAHGPVDKVTRIDIGEKTAWTGNSSGGEITISAENLFGGEKKEGGVSGKVDFDMGTATQGKNTYLKRVIGADVPAYRGVFSAILKQTYIGMNPYIKKWAIWATRINTRSNGEPQWYIAKAAIGQDMNPAHIIRECLTDTQWGMGYLDQDVDNVSFTAAADKLYAEGMGISLIWDKSATLEEFLQIVLKHINGSLFVDRATGKFTLKLMRDDYVIDDLLLLDESSIQKITDFKRNTISELSNQVSVVFWDSTTGQNNSVTVQDIALAAQQGATIGTTIQYPGFTNSTIATKVAARDLASLSTPLCSATIYTNRKAASLNIGDVFAISWPRYGITKAIMRVTEIELGALTDNIVKLGCVEDAFGSGYAIYQVPADTEWLPIDSDPVPCAFHLAYEAPYYELVQRVGDQQAASMPKTSGAAMIAGVRPPVYAMNASLFSNPYGSGYTQYANADFCPTATISADIGYLDTSISIGAEVDTDVVSVGTYAIINNEIISIQSKSDGLITVKRGVLDTLPQQHASGSRIFFVDEFGETDSIEYAISEVAKLKLCPTTNKGTLDTALAPEQTVTIVGRHAKPYPPANIKFNNTYYLPSVASSATSIAVTWVNRNRLQQTGGGAFLSFTDAGVTLESGVTYIIQVYAISPTNVETKLIDSNIGSANSYNIDLTSASIPAGTVAHRVVLKSIRDGVESMQQFSHRIDIV